MKTKKDLKATRLRYPDAAKVRETGFSVGREYCVMWQSIGGKKAPLCKTCKLVKFRLDCKGNAVGYRDFLVASSRAKVCEALRLISGVVHKELNLK